MGGKEGKLGLNAAWSMSVGGMIGGGIFSTLGVVVNVAAEWAWLSFLVAGLIALAAGYSYVALAKKSGEGGGSFSFVREAGAPGFAGTIAWVLIAGYVLTVSVYAFTFGQYLGHVVGLGPWFARATAVAVTAIFIGLNLRGAGDAGGIEIVLVWFKLVVLVALAAWGLKAWDPPMLSRGVPEAGIGAAMFGASSIFMAYEGFQLLTYDYDDIDNPRRTLPVAVLSSIVVVVIVYVLVALGTTMLIGADKVVEHKEVALAIAGKQAWGAAGLVAVTIAAAFSTGSAINATLFATARLAGEVARHGQLPEAAAHKNRSGVPSRAVIGLGVPAGVLAAVGSLHTLVEAASLAFLCTFAIVCGLACWQNAGRRSLTGVGAVAAGAAGVGLIVRLVREDPVALAFLGVLVAVAVFARPWLLRHTRTTDAREPGKTSG